MNPEQAVRVKRPVRSLRFHADHLFTRRRLSAYIDDQLAVVERRRVEHHIDECPDCGRSARSLSRMVGALSLLRRCHPSRLAADVIVRWRSQTRRDDDARPR